MLHRVVGRTRAFRLYPNLPLWESSRNKNKTVALWGKLVERYKNKEWIGGYDILEPNGI